MICDIINDDCVKYLTSNRKNHFDLTFLDPPFNQGKEYNSHDDNMHPKEYWDWMRNVCGLIFNASSDGGAIYFMQREKNVKEVISVLEDSGWTFQNLIIWKKKTSAVPANERFGKHYQVIVFATKGGKPGVFNKLRINPPLLVTEKYSRPTGMYVTDVWDDIRELTSGYFAGDEPIRHKNGERFHKQQSPVQLLTRIILSSTKIEDLVFDPFAGTGTTNIVARQLKRNSIGIEKDEENYNTIKKRLSDYRKSDDVTKFREDYIFTENLDEIFPAYEFEERQPHQKQLVLFEKKAGYRKRNY